MAKTFYENESREPLILNATDWITDDWNAICKALCPQRHPFAIKRIQLTAPYTIVDTEEENDEYIVRPEDC